MSREPVERGSTRAQFLGMLALVVGWQLFVGLTVRRDAALLVQLLDGLGGQLPRITELFLKFHGAFIWLPALTVIAAIPLLAGRWAWRWYPTILLGLALLSTLALQAWSTEAFFTPLARLIEALGS